MPLKFLIMQKVTTYLHVVTVNFVFLYVLFRVCTGMQQYFYHFVMVVIVFALEKYCERPSLSRDSHGYIIAMHRGSRSRSQMS